MERKQQPRQQQRRTEERRTEAEGQQAKKPKPRMINGVRVPDVAMIMRRGG